METTKRKRGPKPSGVEKVVFYASVTPEQKFLLEVELDKLRSGAVTIVGSKGFDGREPGKTSQADPSPQPIDCQVEALLDDIQRLTDQVSSLEIELEECRLLTYDEKMAYWKARALKAEAYAASKNE